MKRIELLAPAGDLEKLKIALLYGADAVFIGGNKFSLRSRASNFTLEEINEACLFAHNLGKRVFVTCNILMHNIDTSELYDYLMELQRINVDAIICADMAIVDMALKHTNLEVHISTQQSITNSEGLKYFERLKVKRVVLARELSYNELKKLKSNSNIELETFIHGGMCTSYSGRCMLSNNMTNRDANRGGCAHSCRWNYDLYKDNKKLNKNMYFSMGSKDLCLVKEIHKLIELNIDSLKIEGRMKSIHYIATIVKTYKMIIDNYYNNTKILDYSFYEKEIKKAENRLTSHGFFYKNTTKDEQLYNMRSESPTKEFVAIVLKYDKKEEMCYLEQRNYFLPNSTLEVFSHNKDNLTIDIKEIYDTDNNLLDACRHPLQIVKFKTSIELSPYDLIRIIK